MLLALDIGNTNITAGVFEDARLVASWRLATDSQRQVDEYALQLRDLLPMKGVDIAQIDAAALCSVVPILTGVFHEAVCTLFGVEPLIVSAGTRTGVQVLYDSPRDVGADRIADAAAAFHLYGGPAIVVDLGTATVFDAITSDGAYLGGAIAPGIALAANSLIQRTSMLRQVELIAPESAIGRNTIHAMQSGLVLGYVGLVESMVARFKKELGDPNTKVIATGGLAPVIAAETSVFDSVDVDLTLVGLQYIHQLNIGHTLNRGESSKNGGKA
jgi:type III pantothenate kinase